MTSLTYTVFAVTTGTLGSGVSSLLFGMSTMVTDLAKEVSSSTVFEFMGGNPRF